MAGANIGGGEWLLGPLVTAQYGGAVLWIATTSIALQIFYNLAIQRYTLCCGESIFVGFFRTWPGAALWLPLYIVLDLGSYLPYLASTAAVPVASMWLGHIPRDGLTDETNLVRWISYSLFCAAFLPLIFGGKVYNALERVMVTKLVLVLGYLTIVAVFLVSWETKAEILSGFVRFGEVPDGVSWATLAAFAAYAGAGGLSNTSFSNLARDKGWGMGSVVGAIPSAVGGKTIQLSHTGKTFEPTGPQLDRWRGWLRHILRDQCVLWGPACVIGMALPSMLSYEFIRGVTGVQGHEAVGMTARAIAERHGNVFWVLTLLCGVLILFPTQISNLDGISRRWTDVIWIGARSVRRLDGHQVKYVYYALLASYAVWGLIALSLSPNPLFLTILNGVLMNLGMGISAMHVVYVHRTILPREARGPWTMQVGLVACGFFYIGISSLVLRPELGQGSRRGSEGTVYRSPLKKSFGLRPVLSTHLCVASPTTIL
jgi:hypothetical protein